jgi:hypothetical protein
VENATDFLQIYNLEKYLLDSVGSRFRATGRIEPIDFFMMIIWKSNRAKTRIRDKLKTRANGNFSEAVCKIAYGLSRAKDPKERLGVMMRRWGLRLPMASAILTILYPDDFTVYDIRVCGALGIKYKNMTFSDRCWEEYESYKALVLDKTPPELVLRDKDRYLFGKSFWQNAMRDAQT